MLLGRDGWAWGGGLRFEGWGGRKPWLRQVSREGSSAFCDVRLGSLPSSSASFWTEGGTGERQRRSPIKWSSQMLSLKKSMPWCCSPGLVL